MSGTSKTDTATISVNRIQTGFLDLCIVGKSPLILNSMSAKSKGTLLLPEATSRRTKAERAAAGLKHEPILEYQRSVYRDITPNGGTRIMLPCPAFKGAIATAALRLPGTTKTEIGQLVWIVGSYVPVYGVPQLLMSVVRSADMNKTPDIRSRAIIAEWSTRIIIQFVEPNLTANVVGNLLHAAGLICGVGDFRQEKGKGSHGQFRICQDEHDEDYRRIVANGGRVVQDENLQDPTCYDYETEELFSWYSEEVTKLNQRKALPEEENEDEGEYPEKTVERIGRKVGRKVAAKALDQIISKQNGVEKHD